MRPPRMAILALFFAASLFLLCRAVTSYRRPDPVVAPVASSKSRLQSFFSFTAPFTLFPPNAAISLTDDNSTFFPARPAAFGPPLPSHGLSGQLWIGSGFGDDNLQDGEASGELGCNDIPGWEAGTSTNLALKTTTHAINTHSKAVADLAKAQNSKRDVDGMTRVLVDKGDHYELEPRSKAKPVDDGTDDYLHQGLRKPEISLRETTSGPTSHADIQSIQETAEITGKVVLLRRGGCGFLEKVKWAQRRGAVGVIVGDRHKGGPLIQMFARGDTSNVTIPAVFTAYTTAHLLSSLMQPGSFIEDIIDDNGNAALKVQQLDKPRKNKMVKQAGAPTTTRPGAKVITATPKPRSRHTKKEAAVGSRAASSGRHPGLMSRLFHRDVRSDAGAEESRPPSSGRLDWVLVDDWSEEKDKAIRTGLEKASDKGSKSKAGKAPSGTEDSFQIGVQDWRDPDLVSADRSTPGDDGGSPGSIITKGTTGKADNAPKQSGKQIKDNIGPKGGSITPGSGEYTEGRQTPESPAAGDSRAAAPGGLMSKIFGDDDGADFSPTEPQMNPTTTPIVPEPDLGDVPHEGLWVTITPTSSASPFFDTLLVLVISPLITLSVVYALLIVRARIRRRRWRAPKSVVERLPVRTYHTIAPSPSLSPRAPSPNTSSPTTPLLQGSSTPRPRPRSRTTTGIPEADLLTVDAALQRPRSPARADGEPGSSHISSEWKKYMARQSECVVCLEEYVDGVSQVMSLPCGHEFHADCITPWLTTRRRTCPICKGDVVRSLARGGASSPRYEPYQDDSDDEISRMPSRAAHLADVSADIDIEQGILSPSPQRIRRPPRPEGLFNILPGGIGPSPGRSSWSTPHDRIR
ncbi:uncharacterized protein E0L32_004972 [Thyridium curvatum]|uniref:RING-type domain-containing protein n=1 Tax=Thyridium curvatum TaxID=1093900 RepID=A0A507B4W5_9PEZI|nr:uncharacterized protein E0L32_004972 [Thyridium curvatum]TPX14863.1 hypothetical protein E0L32_004972 [Thyridium curvatum]